MRGNNKKLWEVWVGSLYPKEIVFKKTKTTASVVKGIER